MTKIDLLNMYLDTSVEPILVEADGRSYYNNKLISSTGADLELISWMLAEEKYPMVYRWNLPNGKVRCYRYTGDMLEHMGDI